MDIVWWVIGVVAWLLCWVVSIRLFTKVVDISLMDSVFILIGALFWFFALGLAFLTDKKWFNPIVFRKRK